MKIGGNKQNKTALILLEHVVRNIPQYVFWKDIHSNYLGCNENYARLLGLKSPQDIVGRTDLDIGWLPDGDDPEFFRQGDQETIAGKYIVNQEELLSLANGTKILVLVNKAPIFDDDDNVLGVLGVATDITEKKRIEEELQETQNKLAGMMLVSAGIAHELRTPLQAIDASASSLKEYMPALLDAYHTAKGAKLPVTYINPQHQKLLSPLLDVIENETRLAFTVIEMLLIRLQQDDKNQEKGSEICSISRCIEEALRRYPFGEADKEKVHWKIEKNFLFVGNELLVVHVIFNLLKNALYYLKAAGKGDITLWISQKEGINQLHFRDTGMGIPANVLPSIFNQFFSQTHHGAGIGLSFCKKVMCNLGGDITCESKEGEYTDFILSFPSMRDKK